jgi:tetratricopeptide (TPR) repeat protein
VAAANLRNAASHHGRNMTIRIFATALVFMLASAALPAAEPALPPAAGLSDNQAAQRAALFAALAAARNDPDAREIEDRIWSFWRSFADDESRELLEESRQAQLSFNYDEALIYMKALVRHQPEFAEGWNQLGYVYFLAGQYDASLTALDRVLELEPMHYAALAGRGIILIQQGKVDEAQIPLKRALQINPWTEGAQPDRVRGRHSEAVSLTAPATRSARSPIPVQFRNAA